MAAGNKHEGIALIQSDSNVAHGVNTYTVDFENQIENLPVTCNPGSQALCIENGEVYILTTQRKWEKI